MRKKFSILSSIFILLVLLACNLPGGTAETEEPVSLAPGQDDFIIYKKNYGGFFQTNLQTILTKLNIGSLIITGSHLDLCILQTMDEAYK